MTLRLTEWGDAMFTTAPDEDGNTDSRILGHIERVSFLRVPSELHERLEELETEWAESFEGSAP